MSFSLEFEPSKKNELSAYINQPLLQLSDSLRAVEHYSELETSFIKLKDYYSRRVNDLERRLEECIAFHRQTELSMDISRSRINEESQKLSIERYEDLLEFNFKEIQWTKSSRVNESTENNRQISIQKLSSQISRLSDEFQTTSDNFSEDFKSLTELTEKITEELMQMMNEMRGETTKKMVNLQEYIFDCEKTLTSEYLTAEEKVELRSKNLTALIDDNINKLSEEVSLI